MSHPWSFLLRQMPILAAGIFCGAAGASGALVVTVTGVTQTQALLQETGFSGACTIRISSSPSLTPLHPDVDGTEYSGASLDTSRADTITSADGTTRTVTIGHQTDDRALGVYSTWYYQVSGCGGPVSGSFNTANLSTGTTRTEQSPFNRAKWGNLGLPTFDWTTRRSYIDPMTGATLIPMATSIQTWRTGCGGNGCQSSSRAFTDWSGGAGWTNPATILQGAATTAGTSNTNPLDLYADFSAYADPQPYDWHRVLEDIGIVVWGSGSSTAGADRTIDLCIFINPTAGCASKTIQVQLPQGAVSHVSSGSADPDGAFPAAFPSSPFYGWTDSVSPLIRMENQETLGTLSVSGTTLTIASLSTLQNFSGALTAGQKIFISGSGCANNLCTVAGPASGPASIAVNETPTPGNANFRAYGWGIRVWKDDANGSATIGLQFKIAGSNTPIGMQAGGDKCSTVQVTSGDGKTGFLCSLTSAISGYGWLAFIATDGTTRILSSRTGFSFDDTQGNVFYAGATNSAGGWTVLKYTYSGDYTTELNYQYTCDQSGGCPPFNDSIASTDLMPHSANADLDQQIEANQGATLPAYNAAIYGNWTASGAVGYFGSSGHTAYFCNVYAGQGQPTSGGPGWCAVVDLSQSPAKVVNLIHTLDGTGMPNARFGSLHNAAQVDSNPNTLSITIDSLDSNNTSTLHGGPFQAQVMSILEADGATWNTNTALAWPPDGSYYGTCPTNSSGYTTCVTFRLPQGGVCNVAATRVESSNWPCPWNPNYSQHPLMQAGDNSVDLAAPGVFDSEHFRILSVAPDAGNTLRVVAARNGIYDYCSFSPWQGQADPFSKQFAGQLQHANGWTLTMMPGTSDSCGGASLLQDSVTGQVQELGHDLLGHFAIGRGATGINFVTAGATIYNSPFSSLGQIPPVLVLTPDVQFHGIGAQIGSTLQSYTDDSQLDAGPQGFPWAVDMNPFVACGAEALGCGPVRTMANVTGNIYTIQTLGSAAPSNATYKIQPMIGWAGRYQLQDISGPSSDITATPFSMCFALIAGECYPGSAANSVYINVPAAYNPPYSNTGYCTGSISWLNIPCVFFGDNAPGGGIRQFGIYRNDPNGSNSRFVSNGWSSMGRHYPYTHSTVYRNGQWTMLMGTNAMDGFSMTGFMIGLPPWTERRDPDNDFKQIAVKVPAGYQYAEVQFGYSRYIGPNASPANGLFCTSRADGCNTSAASLFNFESEQRVLHSCMSGCTITIPAVGSNILYYRIRWSEYGTTWKSSDVQAVAVP